MINFITIEPLNPTRKQIVEDKMRLRSAYVKHYYFGIHRYIQMTHGCYTIHAMNTKRRTWLANETVDAWFTLG